MASNIDATQPPEGAATTAAMRANMAAAKAEIEALQNQVNPATIIGSTAPNAYGQPVAGSFFTLLELDNIIYDPFGYADISVGKYCIKAPPGASQVTITGHATINVNNASAVSRLHLWRNVGLVPDYTAAGAALLAKLMAPPYNLTEAQIFYSMGLGNPSYTPEAHYHNALIIPALGAGDYVSMPMQTGWTPVLAEGEEWTLYAYHKNPAGQDWNATGAAGSEAWLSASFR